MTFTAFNLGGCLYGEQCLQNRDPGNSSNILQANFPGITSLTSPGSLRQTNAPKVQVATMLSIAKGSNQHQQYLSPDTTTGSLVETLSKLRSPRR